ncbi:hypothetical protein EV702DRAFT_1123055 [Suillus placidus]|uniref:F-box domain-containing protein n=1 Tax=Suillus placidus TaxID=48579 RepID=A0A9P6ZQS1_9AGAM|nr:hypothetical protein EV702DRAFT_1123055 [Suillus placidus]
MEPAICFGFSDLPLEIALLILKYAAQPTLSQRENYTDKNPYSSALSLCLVSRLMRRTVLPELLHTISLRRFRSMQSFAKAQLIQKMYAAKNSDLFSDYTTIVQRMWLGNYSNTSMAPRLRQSEHKRVMSMLVPMLLAAPALAIDCDHSKLVIQSMEDAWTSRTDPNVGHGHSSFPGKTQSLTIMGHNTESEIFKNTRKGSVFLASIPHLTYLVHVAVEGVEFCNISRGLIYPAYPLRMWMHDIPWACMKSLKTFSVVYPHMDTSYDDYARTNNRTGLGLHVERLTVSNFLFKQDSGSFPWVPTPPFPVTGPGEKSMRLDGVLVEVTSDRANFGPCYLWDKAWACGLTD